ncbi:MAG: hypothetical protein U9R15_04715 [Chloroflexota bacterium]|nr:hypothetical protein [Chloroflexota bacterium]
MFNNLTDEQIRYIKKTCDKKHSDLVLELAEDPDNIALQIEACGWEQFCQNIGCKGY